MTNLKIEVTPELEAMLDEIAKAPPPMYPPHIQVALDHLREAVEAAVLQRREDRIETLEEALQRIAKWSDASLRTIYDEPTPAELQKAREVLKASGMTIDALSAYSMRHALKGVGDIAKGVLPKSTS